MNTAEEISNEFECEEVVCRTLVEHCHKPKPNDLKSSAVEQLQYLAQYTESGAVITTLGRIQF